MPAPLLLGIDVGTTWCKAAVVDANGREVAHGRARTPWEAVPTGAEVDADALQAAVEMAVAAALAAAPDGSIVGVGVTGMAETGAMLDPAGRSVAPMLAWHDTRGREEAARFAAEVGAERFSGRTGLACGPMPSLFKVRWLKDHLSETRRAVRWLNVGELVVHRLGGAMRAERSLGSRTGWLDQQGGTWWPEALAWADMSPELLPEPISADRPVGRVAAGRLERADGAVLAIAGHDHLAAAVGAGVVEDADILNSCGTAEALVRAIVGPLSEAATLAAVTSRVSVGIHVVPGRQALMAGFACGIVLQRFLDLLGVEEAGLAALGESAIAAPAGAGGLHVRDGATDRAILDGIGREVWPGLVWRAALESVQRETALRLAPMRSIGGPPRRLVAVGGWVRDPAVRAVKREIVGPFEVPPVTEAGCRGAALIAGVAADLFPDVLHLPPPPGASDAPLASPAHRPDPKA